MNFQSAPCACTILILFAYYRVNVYDFSPSYRGSVHLSPCIILFVSDKRHLSYGSSPVTFGTNIVYGMSQF